MNFNIVKVFAPVLLFIGGFSILLYLHQDTRRGVSVASRINGISLVGPRDPVTDSLFPDKLLHCNWVAIIPYGFSRGDDPNVSFNKDRQWWGEREEGIAALVEMARSRGLQVMMKPHVWTGRTWIGEFHPGSEPNWELWENSYRNYILTFAALSDRLGVEMFCIGTEYKQAVASRPAFWLDLIERVRAVYDGPLTYAANWDNYQNIPFWDRLDYIGIDAYFPLVHQPDPPQHVLRAAWIPLKKDIRDFSNRYGKPVLFTEYGYQSVNGATGNHWEVSRSTDEVNLELQARAYECLMDAFWSEEWFAGGFLWKWHLTPDAGGPLSTDFTPQGKPAETVISAYHLRFSSGLK